MRFLLLSLTLLSAIMLQPAAAQTTSKADIEAVVRDYIAKNGDKLLDSINAYQGRQRADAVKQLIRAHTPTSGPADAPVTIIEFADFECPFCFKTEPTIKQLKAKYGNKLRWAFKYLPLDFHKNATPASLAAAAAHQQGKFWPYREQIFANQDKLGDKLYTDIATGLKLDMTKFNAARASAAAKQAIETDLEDAEAVGARGTPYFLINGQAIPGALPFEDFTKVIDAELSRKK